MYLIVVRQLFGFSITTFRDTFIGLLKIVQVKWL